MQKLLPSNSKQAPAAALFAVGRFALAKMFEHMPVALPTSPKARSRPESRTRTTRSPTSKSDESSLALGSGRYA